jgi:WD40 repeat protein
VHTLADGVETAVLDGPNTAVQTLAFSPDGTLLVGASGKQIHIWRLADRRLVQSLVRHAQPPQRLFFRPDGRVLCSVHESGEICFWCRQRDISRLHSTQGSLAARDELKSSWTREFTLSALGIWSRLQFTQDGTRFMWPPKPAARFTPGMLRIGRRR